jgi:hypothetical protein
MKSVARFFAYIVITASLVGLPAAATAAQAKGQDFPGTKCTCKGCGNGGGDVTGQCASVCKDKTVYSKGSEPYDYCKAAMVRPPGGRIIQPPAGGTLSR